MDFPGKKMSKKLTYLPQLDGLRALAVLAVIVFHSRADWLSGGYVGVDIFFCPFGLFDYTDGSWQSEIG